MIWQVGSVVLAWAAVCAVLVVLSVLAQWAEGAVRTRRLHREIDRDWRALSSGSGRDIDIPLPPKGDR